MGAGPWAMEAAEEAFGFLVRHMWEQDGGGFRHKVGREGNPEGPGADPMKDFYDHSFVLFGLAWLLRVTDGERARHWIDRTLAFLDRVLADPEHGGYHEDDRRDPYPLPRRQNPHMHLLEALLALYESTGERDWLDRAGGIIALFQTHFFDHETGTLREFMALDFSRRRPRPVASANRATISSGLGCCSTTGASAAIGP